MSSEFRVWGGCRFEWVADLAPTRGPDNRPLELIPQARYSKAATAKLHPYGHGRFCSFKIPWSQVGAGVYVITVDERPVYVGECRDLAQRFNIGYGSIQPRNCYRAGSGRTAR